MKEYKTVSRIIICLLFILFLVVSCNDILSPDKESSIKTSDVDTIQRGTRPCEIACNQNNATCHTNCGSSPSCHDQCENVYRNCLGYWSVQTRGTSICNVDYSVNYITLHINIKIRTTDTLGFYGCDSTFWPEYGKSYRGRTLVEGSFWLWKGGDAEAWVNQQKARYGMGIGCP